MILTYHSVGDQTKDRFWVSRGKFEADLRALRTYRVCSLADYRATDSSQVVITFDDGHKNLMDFAVPLLHEFGYPFEVFLIGKHWRATVEGGGQNFLNRADLDKIVACGGILQYHSQSHFKMPTLSPEVLAAEVPTPDSLKVGDPQGFAFFSYPYHAHSREVRDVVSQYYRGAVAGPNGRDDNPYLLKRITVTEELDLARVLCKNKIRKFFQVTLRLGSFFK